MTKIFSTTILLLLAGALAPPTFGGSATVPEPAALHAGAAPADTVHVAPPAGEMEADRASVMAAVDKLEPGGTLQFAAGTYLVGERVRVPVPGVTILGHPAGTTLRGCEPSELERRARMECMGLELTGGRQTVRGLTFEHARFDLILGCCIDPGEAPPSADPGGYLVEDNTFRASGTGVRVIAGRSEITVIQGNRFRDLFHAVGVNSGTVHIVDNDVSASRPERVPSYGHTGGAITVRHLGQDACDGHVIAGNRIEDHPSAIVLVVRDPGTRCRGSVIRDNMIVVRRARFTEARPGIRVGSEADSTVVGVPIAVVNLVAAGNQPSPPAAAGRGGEAVIGGHLIEGNRVMGADGIGIEIRGSSGNRIVDNAVTGIERRDPFPGNVANSADPEAWRAANGSGIWISPGSEDNEIAGNTFEDVAGDEVFLEGDRNRVELRSASDSVRDLGRGNEVTAADSAGVRESSYWQPLASPDRASAWLSRSPDGTLFAGTRAGLFVSEDLGRSWHLRGSANRVIGPPLVTPEGALLAGSYRQGILRSRDGGRTWTSVGFERNIYTGYLVRDREGRIYARASGAVEDEPTGVFRSDDDGRTWTLSGLAGEDVYDLSIPRPGVLFAGTESGLVRSQDGGDTWSPAGELPSKAPVSEVVAFGGDLFASMGSRSWRIPGGGVARSPDGGDTWEPTEGLPAGAAVQDLVVHGGMLFAAVGDLLHDEGRGLYRLDSDGRFLPSGLDDVLLLSLLSTPDGLFAGARELGVFRSEDGRSWTGRSEGLRNWSPVALAVPTDGTLYALTDYALTEVMDLRRSVDRGSTWTSTPRPEGSAVPTPWSMIVSPEGRLLLAAEGGILVSDDGGRSWEHRPIPEEEGEVFALSAGAEGEVFAVVRREAAYVSTDEGRSWKRLDLPGAPGRALFSSRSGTRFVTTGEGFHRRSEDGSWEEVSGEHVWALAVCGEALIAGTYARGLLRSTDDGRTWSPVTEELRARSQQSGYLSFTAVVCLPGGGVLAGTFWDGVFYSPDAGETWRDATAGLPAKSVQDFAVSPDGQVFVSTPAGVFVNVALPDE